MQTENPTDERRVFERFPARFPTRFKDTRYDYGTNVALRDASAEGVKIVSKERLSLKDTIDLEVKLPDSATPFNIKGEVVWITQAETNMWDIGLKFHAIDFVRMSRLYKFV